SGSKVLIHGASGGVGHVAVQLAKHAGAHVVATTSAHNREFVLGVGADEAHDYRQSPFESAIRDMDVALDTRGGPEIASLVRAVRPGGMIVSLKGGGDQSGQNAAVAKDVQIRSIIVRPDRDVLMHVGGLLQDRSLSIEIASEFAL